MEGGLKALPNLMLSTINERVFDNGGTRIDVPMIALYGAPNELPHINRGERFYNDARI